MFPPRGPAAYVALLQKIYHTPLQCVNVKGALMRAAGAWLRRMHGDEPGDGGNTVLEMFYKGQRVVKQAKSAEDYFSLARSDHAKLLAFQRYHSQ
jgi:hypothetical protein